MTGTVYVFQAKKLIVVVQNLGDFGANGDKGSKFLVENVIFGIADPDFTMQLLWGYDDD